MPSLFIANTSNKNNEFNFRLPERTQLRTVQIPAGMQMEVLKNASKEEVDSVIKQHEPYGLVNEAEIKKICKFAGTVYSIDKPVRVNSMELAMEANNDILLQEGHEQRKIAAVALNDQLNKTLDPHNSGLSPVRSMEVDVQEIPTEATDKRAMLKTKIKVAKS